MPTFIVTAKLPEKALAGYLMKPEDRSGPLGDLVAAAGGALKSLYYTTGDSDFLMVIEAEGPEVIARALLVAGGAGMITDANTRRAWTGEEFAEIVDQAAAMTGSYSEPGT
ncbi:MAG: GYD domain-containing protein [Rhodobacteraceae bacterium]|nr:GYD domain-containing protein [Paracoccaceae bacterium]